jgi:hypothetical protein
MAWDVKVWNKGEACAKTGVDCRYLFQILAASTGLADWECHAGAVTVE